MRTRSGDGDGPPRDRTRQAAADRAVRESLRGERRGVRALWPFLGPAFVAAVAYVDPGNFATNVAAGSRHGYLLLWAVLLANLAAMLVQTLSAKLGVATGRSLPALCRERLPRPVLRLLWAQGELMAMATDLAEVVGAAIGLQLLFGLPLLAGGAIAAAGSFLIVALQLRGIRSLEAVVAALLAVVVVAFIVELLLAVPDGRAVARGLVPAFDGEGSLLLAAGIVGATVMPHVIYLHSALATTHVDGLSPTERWHVQRLERLDVLGAMVVAGFVNLAMLVVFAATLQGTGADTLAGAHEVLGRTEGELAATLLGVALLVAGLSSASVGTMAGQVVMDGFLGRRLWLPLRQLVTVAPALVVLAAGAEPTHVLVLSQVALSFGLPFALVPLVLLTSSRRTMGALANRRPTTAAAVTVTALVVVLNVVLLVATLA